MPNLCRGGASRGLRGVLWAASLLDSYAASAEKSLVTTLKNGVFPRVVEDLRSKTYDSLKYTRL
jgi:hypothetical protein